jgi:peptidyl-tRNA hydrolase, PTH1 family
MSIIRMIVGLGNPGREYENTRHNIGFMAIDLLAQKFQTQLQLSTKFESSIGKVAESGIMLMKPLTFMNLSGRAISKMMRFYQWKPEEILLIYDDVALDMGRIRIREKGSHGGHNGVRSTIEHLGNDHFPRIKLGIGAAQSDEMTTHVLGKFHESERESLKNMLAMTVNAVQECLSQGVVRAATTYNTISNQTFT